MSDKPMTAMQEGMATVLRPFVQVTDWVNGVVDAPLSMLLAKDGWKLLIVLLIGFAIQWVVKLPAKVIAALAVVLLLIFAVPVLIVKPMALPESPPYLLALVIGMVFAAGWRVNRWWSWFFFVLGLLFFILPLFSMAEFSLSMRRGVYSFDSYVSVLGDPKFRETFTYSVVMALCTIVVGVLLVVPTAYWVRLKMPELRGVVEFITLLPLVIPAIVIVFGYIRLYNTSSWLPLTGSIMGTNILLMFGYVVLALPYMYRAVDTGLRSIDIATMTEAAQSLGAGWITIFGKIILPNVLVAVLSGAFLTFAIVIGEFTFAALLNRPAFGPYLQIVGVNRAYEPSALAVIAFAITWACMGLIQLVTRLQKHTRAVR